MKTQKIRFDIESANWTKEQKESVKKLFSTNSIEKLNKNERELIKDLRIAIGSGTPSELTDGPVCRFDVKCVRID